MNWDVWVTEAAQNSNDWLRRIADPGIWVLAVFCVWAGASLIAARLLALVIPIRWMPSVDEDIRKLLTPVGVILIIPGSVLWTLVGTTGKNSFLPGVAPLAVCLDLLGMLALAFGLALRLRLQVKVVGSDGVTSPVHSSYVAARMAALGASKPRGLLFPHGTDTAHLPESALSTADTTTSKIAASILSLIRILTSVIPWKAEIVIVDKETGTVTLRRNGTQVESELIAISALLPNDSNRSAADADRALLTAAAAFILFHLSEAYPKLRYGLAGAEQWQSVAAQVLATTPPWRNDPKISAELFARAVDYDPKNLAAWLGFLAKRIGSYGSPETLKRGLPLLQSVLQELNMRENLKIEPLPDPKGKVRGPTPEEALRIRILRTLTIFTNNGRVLENDPTKQKQAAMQALEYASQLMEAVQSALKRTKDLSHLNEYADRIKPLAGSLYIHVCKLREKEKPAKENDWWDKAHEWKPKGKERKDTELGTLRYYYDEACARLEEKPGNKGAASALGHLELALALQELRYGVASDPSFKPLRHNPLFASLVDNAARIASFSALTGHSEKLTAVGVRFASDFLTRNSAEGDKSLAQTLQVPIQTITWMRGVCELAEGCPDPVMAVDWTNLLTDEGVDNPTALRALVKGSNPSFGTRFARIVRNAERSSVEAPTEKDLGIWASRLAGEEIPDHPRQTDLDSRTDTVRARLPAPGLDLG